MEISAKRDRGAFHHCRACDRIHSVFRSLRDSDDGKRRIPLDLRMRSCCPSESSPRSRRQQVDSKSVLGDVLGHAGGPLGIYLPELPVRVDHDDSVDSDLFVRGIGVPTSNRTIYQDKNLAVPRLLLSFEKRWGRGDPLCSKRSRPPIPVL